MNACRCVTLGDRALLIEFDEANASVLTRQIRLYCDAVKSKSWQFVQDLVPAFSSICIHYDPLLLIASGHTISGWISQLDSLETGEYSPQAVTTHRIPICYDNEFAWDLLTVAQHCRYSPEKVIELHACTTYTVAMLGFAPGFPYLQGLAPDLQLPRRATPRTQVPAGSVAIAENLCGIYPDRLPGGWHIIGRTPWQLFKADRNNPSVLQPGDQVIFEKIDRTQFEAMASC